jgi:Domain of unknown function (DUF6438)
MFKLICSLIVCVCVVAGCDDSDRTIHSPERTQDAAARPPSAAEDAAVPPAPGREAAVPVAPAHDAAVTPPLVSDEPDADVSPPPADPHMFTISLSDTACFGTCPVFDVSIDQAGSVNFDGQDYVAQKGHSSMQVAPANARAIYDALVGVEFWQLRDRYVNEADGCGRVSSDSPTTSWTVVVDGRSKTVIHYHGCRDVPEVEALDALEPLLRDKTGISAWIGS